MLVYILGEVGTFYIVLLRVYPSTNVNIFIEIGLYLTATEHKIRWHGFLDTVYLFYCLTMQSSNIIKTEIHALQ